MHLILLEHCRPNTVELDKSIFGYYCSVIHLQFWAYGSWDSLFPISMSPTANLWVQNTIFHDKSAIPLHPGTRWNENFASQRQNYAQKMQDAQAKKSLIDLRLLYTSGFNVRD